MISVNYKNPIQINELYRQLLGNVEIGDIAKDSLFLFSLANEQSRLFLDFSRRKHKNPREK
jgi:hypothetical protein